MNRIVMIDDNPMEHFIAVKLLKNVGLFGNSKHVTNGYETLQYIKDNLQNQHELPDVILLDINMPDIDAWGFLDQYKALQQQITKPIDIYIITSSIDADDMLKAKSYPLVKSYLVKPLSKDVLVKIHDDCGKV
ncbi:response regulator [Mucilaginibacter sp. UR6-1]|uniref:response regulator n=1 Tax=Mucilaginibacter sp. UR6-1 TaxID=1435643 RepID=UPI001E5681F5|nr:response regulator [Mucilaginibacter sp. UR6-1]MCC8408764.1 response regulator [Mucilaginibacter sp. UR6-1]